MEKFSGIVLRIGMGLVMIWFGSQQLMSPTSWFGFLPEWTASLPISQTTFVLLNGWFEIVAGLLLIAGFYTRIVALLLALHLLGIVFSVGYNPTGVRDFGLTIALFSLTLHGETEWSVDKMMNKNSVVQI